MGGRVGREAAARQWPSVAWGGGGSGCWSSVMGFGEQRPPPPRRGVKGHGLESPVRGSNGPAEAPSACPPPAPRPRSTLTY